MCWQWGGRGGQKPRVRGRGRAAFPSAGCVSSYGPKAALPPHRPRPLPRGLQETEESLRGWGDGDGSFWRLWGQKRSSGGTQAEPKKHLCASAIRLDSPAWQRQGQAPQSHGTLAHQDTGISSLLGCKQRPIVFPQAAMLPICLTPSKEA